MAKKPLYSKFITCQDFINRQQASDFAKKQKEQFKQAGVSVKHDINRTPASMWRATLYAKV